MLALALPFTVEQPAWLWLCLLVPLFVVATMRSLAGLDPLRRWAAIAIRSALIILLALVLAGIEYVRRSEDQTVIFVLDRSYSVQSAEGEEESFIREAAKTMKPSDRLGVIDFARHAYLHQSPMAGGYFVAPGRLPIITDNDRTDISSGIRLAMALFPQDTTKRIVLLSDGNDNMGDVLTEARRAKADGIPIDIVALQYQHRNEVYFDRLIAPTYAEAGEQVPLRMIIHTSKTVSGKIILYQNGKLVDLGPEASHKTLKPGANTFYVKLNATAGGTQTYEAQFQPDDDSMDTVAFNNSASAFSFVGGSSPALLVSANPADDQPLLNALKSENVRVEMRTVDQLGEFNLLQMMNYSTILLSNIPASAFTDDQQKAMATFVKDMGSGLIMLGGPDAFGAGGWMGGPIEEIMPVSFEIKHKRVIPRGALVIVMHSCEIPRGNYWGKEMAKKSVDTISSQDYIGVLAYSFGPGGANWEVPLQLNTNKAAVKNKIDKMNNGDMPDFQAMLDMAYKELTKGRGADAAQKHVIVLSDGDPQAPSDKLLRDYANAKITISTIGIGWGAHVMEPTMRKIAEETGGNFYPAKNPKQLPQIFVKESTVVRRPLIVEEPFRPRLINIASDVLGGVASGGGIPSLDGMILTSPKENPNVIVPMVRATDDGQDPVLAYWQYELGKTVAFTSGFWPAWGQQWTQWPKFAKFWSQIVRWSMRQDTPANFDTNTKTEGSHGRITVDALDKDAGYLNNLQLRTNLVGPNNDAIPLVFSQTGPGHYEAEFDAEHPGQYLANVQIYDGGQRIGMLRTGLSVPFSPEYRDLSPNEGLLRQINDVSGGRWLDMPATNANIFKHDLPPTQAKRPAWEWVLAWLFLPAFLLDVSVRRLASWLAFSIAVEVVVLVVLLFGVGVYRGHWYGILGAIAFAELIGWTIRFRYIRPLFEFLTHSAGALAQVGDRSAASLDRLRDTRDRVHDELAPSSASGRAPVEGAESGSRSVALPLVGGEQAGAEPEGAGARIPSRTPAQDVRRRKFEAGAADVSKAEGDLSDALGGAKADETGGQKSKLGTQPPAGDQEDVTSRLLKAKRRAQKKPDEGNQ